MKESLSKVDIATKIAAANDLFEKLSPNERRMVIAKDVIDRLDSNYFCPVSGSYLLIDKYFYDFPPDTETLEVFETTKQCSVCARGAIFVSACLKFDGCKVSTLLEKPERHGIFLSEQEDRFFDSKQIQMIENAYEAYISSPLDYQLRNKLSADELTSCRNFGEKYVSNVDRMKAIMQNIIDNNGTFIP